MDDFNSEERHCKPSVAPERKQWAGRLATLLTCSTLILGWERWIVVAVECVRHKRGGGSVESWVAGGILAVCHAHLSVNVLSWVKVLRREAAWRHSALTRACSRLRWEAHVCREKQTAKGLEETEGWVAKISYSRMMAPLILLWSQTDAILELLDSGTLAHIQIIGFPWINRCSPFTARTADCLHKMFLPLSSWNVFTGNNNSKLIALKRTGNEYELTKLAMNGIPTPCELNRSLIAQSLCREG